MFLRISNEEFETGIRFDEKFFLVHTIDTLFYFLNVKLITEFVTFKLEEKKN